MMNVRSAVAFFGAVCLATPALADQFCFELYFKSDYANCPLDQTGMRWPVTCNSGANRGVNQLVVELWDRDETNADDFIATYTLNYVDGESETLCLNYSWDGVARGETSPDPYIRTEFVVKRSGASFFSQACEDDNSEGDGCSNLVEMTWRNFADTNCVTNCAPDTVLIFNSSAVNYFNRAAMIMNAAGTFEDVFGGDLRRTHNIFYWLEGTQCDTGACQYGGPEWVSMPFESVQRWDTPGHEAGHAFHKQLLQVETLPGIGCQGPHVIDEAINQSCATREGFAHYINSVSWWSPTVSGSRPIKSSQSIEGNGFFGGSSPTLSTCSSNSEVELEVARTFWDLDDVNNEGDASSPGSGDDTANELSSSIMNGWRVFPLGTANRGREEDADVGAGQTPSENSGNLNDYKANNPGLDVDESMLHNATSCQSTG